MPRPPKFDADMILDAALQLLAKDGPRGVSMSAVARELDAPSGSLYHRFASRDLLMATLWLREVQRFQQELFPILETEPARQAVIDAASLVLDWSRRHPVEGRLLLLYRRQDLVAGDWPPDIAACASRSNRALASALEALSKRLGKIDPSVVAFAVTAIPLAAVSEPLAAGRPVPRSLDRAVRVAVEAVIADALS